MIGPSPDASWRDSSREAKFFFLDAQAVFPFVLFLLHIKWWTFFVALFAAAFFTIIRHFGFSVIVFARWVRSFFAGHRKMSRPWWV